jgi:hypothetical protein
MSTMTNTTNLTLETESYKQKIEDATEGRTYINTTVGLSTNETGETVKLERGHQSNSKTDWYRLC